MKARGFRARIILMSASAIALAGAEQGQAAEQTPPPETIATNDGAQTPDVVVTAQRRSERLRDVPIAITALTADALNKANITNTTELAKVTPGLTLPLYGAYVLPSIRGISSSGTSQGDSPNVAIYIDGVYQTATASVLGDLPDVQSVQVLKGPQGTLYGQNAAGGALIVDTILPGFDWKGKATLSYGNYDRKLAQGYISGPLTDTLAISLSGSYQRRDGFAHDILRGGHDKGLRSAGLFAKLLWEISPTTSFRLQGFISRRGDTGPYATQLLNGNGTATLYTYLPCAQGGLACIMFPQPGNKRDFAANVVGDTVTRSRGVSLIGKIGVEELGTLNTVAAYNVVNTDNHSDIDGTAVNLGDFTMNLRGHNYIGEANFVSNKFAGFTLTTGVFFLEKHEGYSPYLFNSRFSFAPGTPPSVYPELPAPSPYRGGEGAYFGDSHKTSYAVYGELNYDITDQLTVTLAGRYSRETQRASNTPIIGAYVPGTPRPNLLPDPRGGFHFSKFTPRAVLRYKANDDHVFYLSYSQGFKSGYVNVANIRCGDATNDFSCIDAPVKPEVVEAFEGGYKGRLFHGLDVNISVFHYNYKDIQVFVYNPILGSRFENAATGKITGADIDIHYRPTPSLTLNGGLSYLHTRYGSFPAATVYIPNPCPASTGLPAGSLCGNSQTAQDVSGNRLLRTPTWTANLSANWVHDTAAGEIGFYAGGSYNSGMYFDPGNRIRQDGYILLDGELSLKPAALPAMRVSVWGKNLTNKTYLQSALQSQLADSVSYAEPRTYGVKFEYQF